MVGRWGTVIDIAGRELERQHEEVAWRDKRLHGEIRGALGEATVEG